MASRSSVLAQALQLPREERAELARRLLESLDEPAGEDAETAWLDEVERRLSEVDDGTAKLHSWESVARRIADRLRANRG